MAFSLDALITGRQFDQLLPELSARFRRLDIDLECTYCKPTNNPALCLDLENATHVGRLTLWTSGACEVEVIRIADGVQVMGESLMVESSDGLLAALFGIGNFMKAALG